jgi:hypothetical protein
MFRKGLSLIVMLGFVLGQMAALPHAHAASSTPANHDSRPHIHVPCFAANGHSHDEGHHHHADGSHHHSPVCDHEKQGHDHDSDAVYLPNNMGDSLPSTMVASVDCLQNVAALPERCAFLNPPHANSVIGPYFSDECSSAQPLYLALRALRI